MYVTGPCNATGNDTLNFKHGIVIPLGTNIRDVVLLFFLPL